MLPLGHISAAFLIASTEKKLRPIETVFIVFGGILLDFDYLITPLLGLPAGTHHFLPSHTPLGALIIWLVLVFVLRKKISQKTKILVGWAILSHLALDDLSYWLGVSGPQIFWQYPFDPSRAREINKFWEFYNTMPYNHYQFLVKYFYQRPRLFSLEIILAIWALVVYLKRHKIKTDGKN